MQQHADYRIRGTIVHEASQLYKKWSALLKRSDLQYTFQKFLELLIYTRILHSHLLYLQSSAVKSTVSPSLTLSNKTRGGTDRGGKNSKQG